MLKFLFEYLNEIDFPGAGMFQYISFRSALTVITALIISTIFGKKIIYLLQKKQIGETVRDLGLQGQIEKKGTPTMGGIIIITSIVIPTILFADLSNVYVILMLVTTVWLGFVGFLDDYIKIFKKEKKGLAGKFKILGQVVLGCVVGLTMFLNEDIVVRERVDSVDPIVEQSSELQVKVSAKDIKSTKTTIPFFKNNEFDYVKLVSFLGNNSHKWAWLVLIIAIIFIVTGVSNGANLTDGLDGLATGTSTIIVSTLGILAYVSGNLIYANYLNIMYIPNSGELVVFASAFIGSTIGFLWYNSYPAQVFMGDTGSLSIGGIIAVFAIMIRKELMVPVLCGIFFMETISVMIQVMYFKRTKRKYGVGKRFYLMAPLHHHYQKKGIPEAKIVTRFWIIGILLAVVTIVTLKIR